MKSISNKLLGYNFTLFSHSMSWHQDFHHIGRAVIRLQNTGLLLVNNFATPQGYLAEAKPSKPSPVVWGKSRLNFKLQLTASNPLGLHRVFPFSFHAGRAAGLQGPTSNNNCPDNCYNWWLIYYWVSNTAACTALHSTSLSLPFLPAPSRQGYWNQVSICGDLPQASD